VAGLSQRLYEHLPISLQAGNIAAACMDPPDPQSKPICSWRVKKHSRLLGRMCQIVRTYQKIYAVLAGSGQRATSSHHTVSITNAFSPFRVCPTASWRRAWCLEARRRAACCPGALATPMRCPGVDTQAELHRSWANSRHNASQEPTLSRRVSARRAPRAFGRHPGRRAQASLASERPARGRLFESGARNPCWWPRSGPTRPAGRKWKFAGRQHQRRGRRPRDGRRPPSRSTSSRGHSQKSPLCRR
jgi:hypothetical protein